MNIFKFSFIVFCFLISIKYSFKSRDGAWLTTSLFFTVISDYFLLISHMYEIGVLFFCLVHFFYWVRYGANLKFLYLIFLAVLFFIITKDVLISLAFLYSLFFAVTFVYAFKYEKNKELIRIGMILFLLCDILVAIYNLTNLNLVFFIWLFYAPSQICLALSGKL